MSWYRQQLEEWLKLLYIKADTVLDIGGAQGEVTNRVGRWQVDNYRVLDLPHYDLENAINLDDTLNLMWRPLEDSTDLVFCLEVFEYLIDPLNALRTIERVLKPGGKAYVTFAFAYPHHNELELDALRYTEPGIQRLAESANLKITSTWYRIDKSGLLQQFYAADGMHPSKQYGHHNVTGFIVEFTK